MNLKIYAAERTHVPGKQDEVYCKVYGSADDRAWHYEVAMAVDRGTYDAMTKALFQNPDPPVLPYDPKNVLAIKRQPVEANHRGGQT